MRIQSIIFVTSAMMAFASATSAQGMLTAATAEPIAAILQEAGLQADVSTDSAGDPLIISTAAGANFSVLFYGCTAGKACTSLQLNACFDLPSGTTLEIANTWNKDMRYGKASLNENLDPCLMMDIDMTAGIAVDTFKSSINTWSQVLGKFTNAIGF